MTVLCTTCARPIRNRTNPNQTTCNRRCRQLGARWRLGRTHHPVWRQLVHTARAESWALRELYRAHGHIRYTPRKVDQ